MTKLAHVAVTALILMFSGCTSMGDTSTSSGAPTDFSQDPIYSGGN